jgi:hypothetical protein
LESTVARAGTFTPLLAALARYGPEGRWPGLTGLDFLEV